MSALKFVIQIPCGLHVVLTKSIPPQPEASPQNPTSTIGPMPNQDNLSAYIFASTLMEHAAMRL